MKRLVWFAVFACLLLAAAAAWAQPEDTRVYQLKTIIKFTEVTLGVSVAKPAIEVHTGRLPADFDKRIELKTTFFPELVKSVEKL